MAASDGLAGFKINGNANVFPAIFVKRISKSFTSLGVVSLYAGAPVIPLGSVQHMVTRKLSPAVTNTSFINESLLLSEASNIEFWREDNAATIF